MEADALLELLQHGVLGFVLIALILGWIVPGKSHDRAVRRADRLEEENKRIRDRVEDKVVPLVQTAIASMERHKFEQHD